MEQQQRMVCASVIIRFKIMMVMVLHRLAGAALLRNGKEGGFLPPPIMLKVNWAWSEQVPHQIIFEL